MSRFLDDIEALAERDEDAVDKILALEESAKTRYAEWQNTITDDQPDGDPDLYESWRDAVEESVAAMKAAGL